MKKFVTTLIALSILASQVVAEVNELNVPAEVQVGAQACAAQFSGKRSVEQSLSAKGFSKSSGSMVKAQKKKNFFAIAPELSVRFKGGVCTIRLNPGTRQDLGMLLENGRAAMGKSGYNAVTANVDGKQSAAFSDGRAGVVLRARYSAKYGPENATLSIIEVE